jgi:hypothetical protein
VVLHHKTGVLDGINVPLNGFLGAFEPFGQLNCVVAVAHQQLYQVQQPFQLGLVHGVGGVGLPLKVAAGFVKSKPLPQVVASAAT